MCTYRYVYYSRCQHAELYRVTACDRARGLASAAEPDSTDSANPTGRVERAIPSRVPPVAISPRHYRTLRHHPTTAMAPSIAAASPLHSRTSLTQQHTSGLNFMPHSTRLTRSRAPEPDPFAEEPPTTPTSHGNAHIDIPTGTQSSVTMSVSNDGKVMKLVARFESYDSSEGSDVSQVHGQDIYVHTTTASAGEASHEHKAEADSPTGSGQADPLEEELDPCSPRKPLPAQWGPVLRTQMRSEERERRKAANSSSPSNPPSPRKLQRAEPKASPKSATIAARLSPNKSNVAESRHSRATSSVSGESVYFTANNSPVSSSDGDSASDVSCSHQASTRQLSIMTPTWSLLTWLMLMTRGRV